MWLGDVNRVLERILGGERASLAKTGARVIPGKENVCVGVGDEQAGKPLFEG